MPASVPSNDDDDAMSISIEAEGYNIILFHYIVNKHCSSNSE